MASGRGFLAGLVLAGLVAEAGKAEETRPVVHVAYFIPTDRKAEPDHVARLDRVLTEVQRFYRAGMQAHGHGPLTFELDRDEKGSLRVHEVRARGPMRAYGRDAAGKVRDEVKAALARQGIDIDGKTVVIFQLLLDRQGERATEIGPYVGGGGPRGGTAWVYDDARLDPRLLGSREPGGYYLGPCSLGQFNTHYIGGVAHELGHALGLPHERERDVERPRQGLSLMGGGNHTYGRERRGEGPGAFLTKAGALPLSVHPLFTGKRTPSAPMTCRLVELKVTQEGRSLVLTGRLREGPPAVGVVAYNDPEEPRGDYDALGWTCPVDGEGRLRLVVDDLAPGRYELRLRAYGANGESRAFRFAYAVGPEGRADLSPFLEGTWLAEALAAFRAGNRERLRAIREEVKKGLPADAAPARKLAHLEQLLALPEARSLAGVGAEVKRVRVADLKMETAQTGWGRPLRHQVLVEGDGSCLLEVGGVFFSSGLYAHAPAHHVLRLDGGWKSFTGRYGLQDGHDGSVVFVVKGDGKELFRSRVVRDHQARETAVDVAGVRTLELVVEDGGDGANSDWGVWLDPELTR